MPIGNYKRTEKHLAQLAEARKKSPVMSTNYWKGKKRPPFSIETKRKMSESAKRVGTGKWTKYKHRPQTEETKRKISLIHKGKPKLKLRGDKNWNWKGGLTPINKAIRQSLEYKIWRRAVFERDDYTCVWCLKRGGELHADHIKQFAFYPELRFAIDNGRTLCKACHETTETYKRHIKL